MKTVMDYLKPVVLWVAACVIAIGLLEYQAMVGLAFAVIGGVALGILTFRGARA